MKLPDCEFRDEDWGLCRSLSYRSVGFSAYPCYFVLDFEECPEGWR